MMMIIAEVFLSIRWVMNLVTFVKMCKFAPKTFLNRLFMFTLFIKSLLIPLQTHFLLEVLTNHKDPTDFPPTSIIENCLILYISTSSIVFVDYIVNYGMFLCRLFYAEYAYLLTINKVKMCNTLVTLFVSTFLAWALLIGPFNILFFVCKITPV